MPYTADKKASPRTHKLLDHLHKIAEMGYAFGHQEALTYGIGWKNDGTLNKSDVKEVCGDHPAVIGFELGNLELGMAKSIDSVDFTVMKKLIRMAHKKGAIITLSWHPNNPISKKNAWHTKKAVHALLKGGELHLDYRNRLQCLAKFMRGLRDTKGKRIPLIFRPYHEMNGRWFWWGKGHCKREDFIHLWQQTFQILSMDFKVHNLLYCYSPNLLRKATDYLKYYPGDAYVDVLGIDIYQHLTAKIFIRDLKRDLAQVQKIAALKNKPYALTEVGSERIPRANWWTKVLHPTIADTGIAYALFWRNHSTKHHYAPFPSHASAPDFKSFKTLSKALFLNDIGKII